MDEVVEWVFHALRVIVRFVFQALIEILLEYLISPLAKLIAGIYRPIRHFFRVLFHFDVVASPLAALVVVAIISGPLFIVAKVFESFLMWW
jgi:hypothetical protein